MASRKMVKQTSNPEELVKVGTAPKCECGSFMAPVNKKTKGGEYIRTSEWICIGCRKYYCFNN